jgi:hypothetical protein
VVTSLLVDVVSREPLAAADGRSGSLLERVVLADGRALVVKHVLDGGDWIMRATADHGRAAELWSAGVLARVPEVIDHTVVGAEQVPGGWVVIMRDVSAALVPDHARVGRDDSRRVLEAAAALHAAFAGDPPLELCSLADRYGFLSPATARREAGGADEVPRLIGRGWERSPRPPRPTSPSRCWPCWSGRRRSRPPWRGSPRPWSRATSSSATSASPATGW